ncbi:hypothetical protein FF1_037979 [Malus domestica]
MSEPGSSSDEGSSSFSSKSESAMSESSGSLLESCTRETLDDLPNRQTLAIASSSSMALGEGVSPDMSLPRRRHGYKPAPSPQSKSSKYWH